MTHANPFLSLSLAAALSVSLTGCYTQLATRGYAAFEPGPAPTPPAAAGDSLSARSAPGAADTLAPLIGAPTVIVNNYYDPAPSYRGYAHWEWDYPLISVGYYSPRFDRFHRPWWWDDPGHHRRPYHRVQDSRPNPVTPRPSGPYQSPVRLYNPEPDYPTLRKGRRTDPSVQRVSPTTPSQAAEPAPVRSDPTQAPQVTQATPAPKSSSTPAASSTHAQEEKEAPTLKKGRRR